MEPKKPTSKAEEFFPEDTEEVEIEVSDNHFFVSQKHSKIYTALAKCQSALESVGKNQVNPFYNSKYADIHDIGQAIKKPMADNNLFFMQLLLPGADANEVRIRTIIGHESGEEISFVSTMFCSDPSNPQKIGACQTYLKRYILASALGCTSTERSLDDDANSLTFSDKVVHKKLKKAAQGGVEVFRSEWRALNKLDRRKIIQEDLDNLQQTAETADEANGTKAPPPPSKKPSVVRSKEQEAHSL